MSTHPLHDLTGPLATQFIVLMILALVVVAWGIIRQWKDEETCWAIDWERILVALLEVTFGLILLWKIDQWIKMLTDNGGAR